MKKKKKKDKYVDLTKELVKLWNMKMGFMPIIIGALGTVIEGLLKIQEDMEIRGRVETIQTTRLLRSARILNKVLDTCCHSNFSERTSALAVVKINNNNNNNNCYYYYYYYYLRL